MKKLRDTSCSKATWLIDPGMWTCTLLILVGVAHKHDPTSQSLPRSGAPKKKGYTLPRAAMANADLARIINSTEVQSLGADSFTLAGNHHGNGKPLVCGGK